MNLKHILYILIFTFAVGFSANGVDISSPIDEAYLSVWNYEGNLCDGLESLRLIGEKELKSRSRGGLIFEYRYNPTKSFTSIKVNLGRCSLRDALTATAQKAKIKIITKDGRKIQFVDDDPPSSNSREK